MTNEQKMREKISTTEGLANYLTTYDDSCGEFKVKFMKDNEEFTFTLCTFSIFGILFGIAYIKQEKDFQINMLLFNFDISIGYKF